MKPKSKSKCFEGKKVPELGLSNEPHTERYVQPIPTESFTMHGMSGEYVSLEKIAEKLRLIYDAFDSKPDWTLDNQENIRHSRLISPKKDFKITYFSKEQILEIIGTPQYKYGRVTGYNICIIPTTQVQTQLKDLLKH